MCVIEGDALNRHEMSPSIMLLSSKGNLQYFLNVGAWRICECEDCSNDDTSHCLSKFLNKHDPETA